MGLFSNIKSAIFGNKEQDRILAEAAKPETRRVESVTGEVKVEPTADASPAVKEALRTPTQQPNVTHVSTAANDPADPASMSKQDKVDVAAELDAKAKAHPEDLDWQRSIVDLMKLVGMDSSYSNRKELAVELGYSEADIESKGSAEMNMWLHKHVLAKLAEDSSGDKSRLFV